MTTFGQTVYLWRVFRGLTQAGLSGRVGISRPNLSRIESDTHDVSLRTLRALAEALDVSPGTLVDGRSPQAIPENLSRAALERIARGVNGQKLSDPREEAVAQDVRLVISTRLRALNKKVTAPAASARAVAPGAPATCVTRGTPARPGTKARDAWLRLSQLPPEARDSLIERSIEHAPDLKP